MTASGGFLVWSFSPPHAKVPNFLFLRMFGKDKAAVPQAIDAMDIPHSEDAIAASHLIN